MEKYDPSKCFTIFTLDVAQAGSEAANKGQYRKVLNYPLKAATAMKKKKIETRE